MNGLCPQMDIQLEVGGGLGSEPRQGQDGAQVGVAQAAGPGAEGRLEPKRRTPGSSLGHYWAQKLSEEGRGGGGGHGRSGPHSDVAGQSSVVSLRLRCPGVWSQRGWAV